jgi:hypothetical protein
MTGSLARSNADFLDGKLAASKDALGSGAAEAVSVPLPLPPIATKIASNICFLPTHCLDAWYE